MKKPYVLTPPLLRKLADLPGAERANALLAIVEVSEAFGRPHIHSGLSIRKLPGGIFECRAGLKLRLLFRDLPASMQFEFIGNHDEVQKFIRTLK